MKFDLIVGNPPFAETIGNSKQSFWFKFVMKSIELLKEDGYINMITPTSLFSIGHFGKHGNKITNLVSQGFEFTSIMSDVTDQFNVKIPICQFEMCRKNDGKCVVDDVLMDIDYTKPLPFKISPMNISILQACYSATNRWAFTWDKSKPTDYTVKLMGGRFKKYEELTIGLSSDSAHKGDTLIIHKPSEVANYETIFRSKLFQYFFRMLGGEGSANATGILQRLPYLDTSRPWTDAEIYKEFGLSPEQIAMIEEN
jgi:hypothetical protein